MPSTERMWILTPFFSLGCSQPSSETHSCSSSSVEASTAKRQQREQDRRLRAVPTECNVVRHSVFVVAASGSKMSVSGQRPKDSLSVPKRERGIWLVQYRIFSGHVYSVLQELRSDACGFL